LGHRPEHVLPVIIEKAERVLGSRRWSMAFECELATYLDHWLGLLAHEGKFVAILGSEITQPFDTYEDALAEGYHRFTLEPFMVKEIREQEEVFHSSRVLPTSQPLTARLPRTV
jgi:hypothetical protein